MPKTFFFYKSNKNYLITYNCTIILCYNLLTNLNFFKLWCKGALYLLRFNFSLSMLFLKKPRVNNFLNISKSYYLSLDFLHIFKLSKNFSQLLWKKASLSCFSTLMVLNNKLFFLNAGKLDSLRILGYARRAWYSKTKKFIFLKVGNSYINKFILPHKLLVILNKKRLITLYTFSVRLLIKYAYFFFFLKPADHYKGFGIRLASKKLVLKEVFTKKKH